MKNAGDYTVAAIERGEAIPKLAFRAAEMRGDLAPHIFVENPTNAICQDCGMEIRFEEVLRHGAERNRRMEAVRLPAGVLTRTVVERYCTFCAAWKTIRGVLSALACPNCCERWEN